jgi:iron(III) transport system ATP-binding protein
MNQSVILHLEGVTKQFSPTIAPAVSSVNLTLCAGEILIFLGPSGCGKTTLLRLIAGFDRPQFGTIEIDQQVVAGKSQFVPPELRDVGMVFQDYALFPHLNVAKNIAFGLRKKYKNFTTKTQIADRIAEVIGLVSLQGLENRYPHELSGGQQQRVALARALAPRPALVLLDEPLSNLDAQIRLKLRQELRDILKAAGTSAIFVTHDREEAFAIADRVAIMQKGHIEQIGTPYEIYQNPGSRFVAEFVTQANFLPAVCQGRVWETELGSFAMDRISQSLILNRDILLLPHDISKCNISPCAQVELMVRQEDLLMEPDESSQITISDRIFLGRELIYYLKTLSGQILIARTNANRLFPVGMRVKLSIVKDSLSAFSASEKSSPMQTVSAI